MTPFEYVTAAVLLIIGLGITRLLSALVEAFRARARIRDHWIPLAWALLVFEWQMQFLWASFELSRLIESWTALKFIIMLTLALLLFVAGALVLPREPAAGEGDALRVFLQDGRWALVSLAAYSVLAFLANPVFFGTTLFSLMNLFLLLLALILLATFFARSRRWLTAGTVAFAIGSVAATLIMSPGAYH